MTISATPLTPVIGALVSGVDLARPLAPADAATLTDLLHRHLVLFFENQALSPALQRDLAANFGQLHIHPIYPHVAEVPEIIVLDTHADNLPDNDNWHTDVTFIETPPLGAILSAQRLPPTGGDTLWASGIAAYNALSAPWRDFLGGLDAEHDFVKSFPLERYAGTDERGRWFEAQSKHPPVRHPVIRTHPVTGRKALFVNEGFTTRIIGLTPRESEATLRFLLDHVARPEFTLRWRWREGDVAFWDNRVTQHYATADYLPARRVMHRATILGDRPYRGDLR